MISKMKIAIDGPAGAGKSTVAKKVAERLKLLYVDTGAMYRAVTWAILKEGITDESEETLKQFFSRTKFGFEKDGHVFVNRKDITAEIRDAAVTKNVSRIASNPVVRHYLTQLQREIAENHDVVMDGRDIGTHVMPDADVKIFLTASLDERAERRRNELIQKGFHPDREQLKREIMERDEMDSKRDIAPLRKADNAYLIDSTGLTIEEVVDRIVSICKNKDRGS